MFFLSRICLSSGASLEVETKPHLFWLAWGGEQWSLPEMWVVCIVAWCVDHISFVCDHSGSFYLSPPPFQSNSKLCGSSSWKLAFFPVIMVAILGSPRMELKNQVVLVTSVNFLALLKSLGYCWAAAEVQSACWSWKVNMTLENLWSPKLKARYLVDVDAAYPV